MLPPFVGPEHVRAAQWQGMKQKPTQFASNKNTPGKSSSEVVEHSAEWLRGGRRVKKVVDTRFGYDTDMVKPYVPETTAE